MIQYSKIDWTLEQLYFRIHKNPFETMEKANNIFNQASHEPLIVGMALLCAGVFVAFAFCEVVTKLSSIVNLIMGDD